MLPSCVWDNPRLDSVPVKYVDGHVVAWDFALREFRPPVLGSYGYFTKKQKRLFHRTYSGIQVGFERGEMLIWWTLTTRYNREDKAGALLRAEKELNEHFQVWKKRVCRFIQKKRFYEWLHSCYPKVNLGSRVGKRFARYHKKRLYLHRGKLRTWYSRFEYKFNYIKVRTTEGGGVIHGFLRKSRDIPILNIDFLREQWQQIHYGSFEVDFQEVKPKSVDFAGALKAAMYFCGTYFNQQPVVRCSSSQTWIFCGASSAWVRGRVSYGLKKIVYQYSINDSYYVLASRPSTLDMYVRLKQEKRGVGLNVQTRRKSIIQLCMESRKSRRDSGYINALYQWLLLIRNAPKNSRQQKLTYWSINGTWVSNFKLVSLLPYSTKSI